MAGSITDTVTLSNGMKMPWLGFGTYKIPDGPAVEQAVKDAIKVGYRHVDTATFYKNETGVGKAIRESGVPRDQIFLTTKVWNDAQREGYDAVLKSCDDSLKRLGLEHLDLLLLHWPVEGKFKEAWRALEKVYEEGLVRSIGVSNFYPNHLEELLADAHVAPAANQIELHPHLFPREVVKYCDQHKIVVQAWSPLMQGKVAKIPEIVALGAKYGKTPAQITLRWNLDHGIVTIPKSTRIERMKENADIFDFELSTADVALVDGLHRDGRIGPHPDKVTF